MSLKKMASLLPLHFRSGVELAADIKAKKISSVELLECFIARIEAHDTAVNSVVVRGFEAARKRAAEADAALARGENWGVFHGLPVTVKENNDVAGLPTTVGFEERKGNVAVAHSSAVQRLHDAGAVVFGKTNLPLGVNDVQSFNPVYGCTSNPHDLRCTPGGSSGGSTAALAAGFTTLELGGDIGGSIRTPAHCCGVWGLKPTYGVVPTRSFPRKEASASCGDPGGFIPLDIVVKGPLARHPEDLTAMMDVLAGPAGPAEERGWKLTLPKAVAKPLSEYRVAVWGDEPGIAPVDENVRAGLNRAVKALRDAGATVDEAARPDFTADEMFRTYLQLLAAAESSGLSAEAAAAAVAASLEAKGDSDEAEQARWLGQSQHQWWQAHVRRLVMAEKLEFFFQSYDFILQPVACTTAWPHDHSGPNDQAFWKVGDRVLKSGNDFSVPYHKQLFWACLSSGYYLPSCAFPCGKGVNGLPTGLQAIGPKYSDYACIEFAKALSEAGGSEFGFVAPKAF